MTTTDQRARGSKSQQAYELIHDRIIDGTYTPGARLVLGRIGGELGASVVPVREAVRRLEAEGLVTFERNVGARVAEIDADQYVETMQTLSIVEGAAVAYAVPHLSATQLTLARVLNEQLRDLLDDFDADAFTALNEQFHRTLSDPCPNSHLKDLVDRGWKRLAGIRRSTFRYVPGRARESVEEHSRILDLIGEGADSMTIELAVRDHRLATPGAYVLKLDVAHGEAVVPHDAADRTSSD